jgi:heat shock protein HslJ
MLKRLGRTAAAFAALLSAGSAAGDPPAVSLEGTAWLAEDIDNRGVLDRVQSTLVFGEPGRVAGNGGCNRYFGPVMVASDRISIGPLAATKRACPPAVMDQDDRFTAALMASVSFRIDATGALRLYDGAGAERVRLTRTSGN